MSIKKTGAASLDVWIDGLVERGRVIGIQARGDRFAFGPLARAADLRLDYDVAILPPKALFQPPREDLLTFKAGSGYESVIDSEPFVLLGVHPYDLVGISQMDEVFSQGNPDVHYLERRNNAAIVAVDVQKVSPDVFAGFMGTAYVEDGYDVLLTKIGDDYIVDAGTEKGESLIDTVRTVQNLLVFMIKKNLAYNWPDWSCCGNVKHLKDHLTKVFTHLPVIYPNNSPHIFQCKSL